MADDQWDVADYKGNAERRRQSARSSTTANSAIVSGPEPLEQAATRRRR